MPLKDAVISTYANSLLYTDHIIHEIMRKRYRERNALVIYLSDHGDALFDEDYPELMGHALVPRAVRGSRSLSTSPRSYARSVPTSGARSAVSGIAYPL